MVALFLFSTIAGASAVSSGNILIENIGLGYNDVQSKTELVTRIRVIPFHTDQLKDTTIKVYVPELESYRSVGPVKLTKSSNEVRTVSTPIYGAEPGEYYARIVVYSEGAKRVVHRPFTVI